MDAMLDLQLSSKIIFTSRLCVTIKLAGLTRWIKNALGQNTSPAICVLFPFLLITCGSPSDDPPSRHRIRLTGLPPATHVLVATGSAGENYYSGNHELEIYPINQISNSMGVYEYDSVVDFEAQEISKSSIFHSLVRIDTDNNLKVSAGDWIAEIDFTHDGTGLTIWTEFQPLQPVSLPTDPVPDHSFDWIECIFQRKPILYPNYLRGTCCGDSRYYIGIARLYYGKNGIMIGSSPALLPTGANFYASCHAYIRQPGIGCDPKYQLVSGISVPSGGTTISIGSWESNYSDRGICPD